MIKEKINTMEEGANAISGILALINPAFALMPIFIFGVNRVVNFLSPDDIVKRIEKLQSQLVKKKIDINIFKNKINKLNEHKRYVVSSNFNNILLNCIPETVDIYISILIDYVMNSDFSFEDQLFEIVRELNFDDIRLLKDIIYFEENGERCAYQESIVKEKKIEETNNKIEINNEIAKKKNMLIDEEKSKKIKYIDDISKISENNERYGEYTIFWKDFAKTFELDANININYLLLYDYKDSDYSNWTYMAKSFLKLERLGLIEIEFFNTFGSINSLKVERFHITNYCLKIMDYITNN